MPDDVLTDALIYVSIDAVISALTDTPVQETHAATPGEPPEFMRARVPCAPTWTREQFKISGNSAKLAWTGAGGTSYGYLVRVGPSGGDLREVFRGNDNKFTVRDCRSICRCVKLFALSSDASLFASGEPCRRRPEVQPRAGGLTDAACVPGECFGLWERLYSHRLRPLVSRLRISCG